MSDRCPVAARSRGKLGQAQFAGTAAVALTRLETQTGAVVANVPLPRRGAATSNAVQTVALAAGSVWAIAPDFLGSALAASRRSSEAPIREVVARETPARPWFGAAPKVAWALTLAVTILGGSIAWVALGAGLCQDSGSPGSDAFCNHGGWEASGLVIACLVGAAVVVPAAGVITGRSRLFWIGLFLPFVLAMVDVVLAATLGRR